MKTKKLTISHRPLAFSAGFTLVELLIVITIMGVLASFALITYPNVQKRARDSRREADLETIRTGLELYKADCNSYPLVSQVVAGSALTGDGTSSSACLSTNTYISKVPTGPLGTAADVYVYNRISTTKYTITATLEVGGTYQVSNP